MNLACVGLSQFHIGDVASSGMYCIFSGLMEMKEMSSIRVMEGVS